MLSLCSNFKIFVNFCAVPTEEKYCETKPSERKMKHHAENRASISLHRMFDWSGTHNFESYYTYLLEKGQTIKEQLLDFNCFSTNNNHNEWRKNVKTKLIYRRSTFNMKKKNSPWIGFRKYGWYNFSSWSVKVEKKTISFNIEYWWFWAILVEKTCFD